MARQQHRGDSPRADTERAVTEAEWVSLTRRYWSPLLAEMLVLDSQLALGKDGRAADARQRIYDRLVGRPIEHRRDEVASTITITVRPVEGVGGGRVEGPGGGCVENAMDRSISSPEVSGGPQGPDTHVTTLLLPLPPPAVPADDQDEGLKPPIPPDREVGVVAVTTKPPMTPPPFSEGVPLVEGTPLTPLVTSDHLAARETRHGSAG